MSSDRRTTSSSSEEMKHNAHALRSQVKHDLLNFSYGTISIPRVGSVQNQQQLGVRGQPTANEHLLLVAAGEILDRAIRVGRDER